jgi:hypothetical protein
VSAIAHFVVGDIIVTLINLLKDKQKALDPKI